MQQQENLGDLVRRLENVAQRLERMSAIRPQTLPEININTLNSIVSAPINSFDDLISGSVVPFVQVSIRIGEEVRQMAELVEKLFQYQRSFLIEVSKCTRPSLEFRENHRKSEFFNHYSAISESISAMSWIAIQPSPAPFVYEMIESAKFYTNRVLRDYKERGPNHVMWVNLWLKCLSELEDYIKRYHTTGLVWNSLNKSETFDPLNVGKLSTTTTTAPKSPVTPPKSTSPVPKSITPPPPPPSTPRETLSAEFTLASLTLSTPTTPNKSVNSLAELINKGTDITNNLKKVTDDQKTHKNPTLRAANLVPASETVSLSKLNTSPKATHISQQTTVVTNKTPVFKLEDKKWKIEHQHKQNNLIIENTDIKQSVYVYQCTKCTVVIKGKVNSIIVDSCQRVDLLFDDVLSTVEFINSNNVQMQVLGKVPTITIEKTDGCQIYLSKSSLDTELVTSKSTSMNVLLPNESGDDYVEYPIPEQFKTVFNNEKTKLITTPTESI